MKEKLRLLTIASLLFLLSWPLQWSVHKTFGETIVTKRARSGVVISLDQLYAVGYSDTLKLSGFYEDSEPVNLVTVQYTVSHIDTNVVVSFEGSLDKTNWFNLDSTGNTTVTDNETNAFMFEGASAVPYYRFGYISSQGDSTTTVDVKLIFGGE